MLSSFVLACFTGFSCSSLAAKVTNIVEDASGYGPAVGILNSISSKLIGKSTGTESVPANTDQKQENRTGSLFLLLIQSVQACFDYRLIIACIILMMSCCVGVAAVNEHKKITDSVWVEDLSYYLRCIGIRTPRDQFLEVFRYNSGIGLGVKSGGVYQTLKKPVF